MMDKKFKTKNEILIAIPRATLGTVALALLLFIPQSAQAGVMELSGSFWFNQSQYGTTGYQWTRRWGASIGYFFFSSSEIEFAVQDVYYRTNFGILEDTSLHDRIYSIDWVQSLLPREYRIQPYVKVGLGELHRDASGSILGLGTPASYSSLTAILGAGIRVYIFKTFSVKAEGTTYLTEGVLSTWQQNVSFSAGFSLFF